MSDDGPDVTVNDLLKEQREQTQVFAVVFDVHYECGDAVGVALSLEAAQRIAQEHATARHGYAELPPLEWRDDRKTPGYRGWSGRPGSGDWGFSYTVTEWAIR